MALIPTFDSFGTFISQLNSKNNTKFSFTVDGSSLDNAIQKVATATSFDSSSSIRHHLLVVDDGSVSVVGFTNEVFSEIRVQAATSIQGSGYVSINSAVLQGLVKNRNELTFSYDAKSTKNLLNFKSVKGVYKGELAVLSLEDHLLPLVNDKIDSFEIKTPIRKEIFSAMVDGVKNTTIKNIYNTSQAILTYVVFSVKTNKLKVFSYDGWHLAMYTTPIQAQNEDKPFALSFSTSLFDMLDKVSQGGYGNIGADSGSGKTAKTSKSKSVAATQPIEDYFGFGLVHNSLTLSGAGFRVLVPYVQANKKDFDSPTTVLNSLPSPQSASFSFNERLITSATNLYSLMTVKGLQYTLDVKEAGAYMSIKTSNGDASDKIPSKNLFLKDNKPLSISFDPDIFKDLVKHLAKVDLVKNTASLNVFDTCYRIDYSSIDDKFEATEVEESEDEQKPTTPKARQYTLTLLGSIFNE